MQPARDRLIELAEALTFDADLSVEQIPSPSGGDDLHVYIRHAANPEWRQRVRDHETPAEVAASLLARQLEVAPTAEELAEASREERRRVRQQAARLYAPRLHLHLPALDVGHRDKGPDRRRGGERRPAARRRTSRTFASRGDPDEPEPPLGRHRRATG